MRGMLTVKGYVHVGTGLCGNPVPCLTVNLKLL